MSEGQIISIISLLGALILFGSSYRAHRIGGRKALVMVLAWLGIFAVTTAVFVSMG